MAVETRAAEVEADAPATCDDLLKTEEDRFRQQRQTRNQFWKALMAKVEIEDTIVNADTGGQQKFDGFRSKIVNALRTIAWLQHLRLTLRHHRAAIENLVLGSL